MGFSALRRSRLFLSFAVPLVLFSAGQGCQIFQVPAVHHLVAVGDIGWCGRDGAELTADLARRLEGPILTLGDITYQEGTAAELQKCFDLFWGDLKPRIKPIPGNHDYMAESAGPYFEYFGEAAGDPKEGWYSFDLDGWHLVGLNSNCDEIGGCGEGSLQYEWLQEDLANTDSTCIGGYMHYPVHDGGPNETPLDGKPLWSALNAAGAEFILSGHQHNYQRFAPMDADGNVDEDSGTRQFVIGTGGSHTRPAPDEYPGLEFSLGEQHGVLSMTLEQDSYSWQFLTTSEDVAADSGTASCN